MQTSVPGSSTPAAARRRRTQAGFTLVELLVVLVLIALSSAVVALSLRDADASQLDEEAERLSTLLEMARAEARISGLAVRWVPAGAEEDAPGLRNENGPERHFRFVGAPQRLGLPTRWLDEGVSAQVLGARSVLLGPEAILPPQRILLSLGQQRRVLASDGLSPFRPVDTAGDTADTGLAAAGARP
jgi:general secretion pathway protein H